jgi:hypothetical protein
MNQIEMTDLWVLSSFRERIVSIPGIHERTIPAAQALVDEANRAIIELKRNGHSYKDALDLCNRVVNDLHQTHKQFERNRAAQAAINSVYQ